MLIQEDGQYKVLADGKAYRILLASITFYRAEVGDQVTILIPKSQAANWGSVEAIIPKHLVEAAAKATMAQAASEDAPKAGRVVRKKKSDDGELSPKMD